MANTALILPRVASRLNVFLQTPTQTNISYKHTDSWPASW